jgi:hypothetical protein
MDDKFPAERPYAFARTQQAAAGVARRFLGALPIRDVHRGIDVAGHDPARTIPRDAGIENPRIDAVEPTQAVFSRERFRSIYGAFVDVDDAAAIVRVDAALT